MCTKIWSKTVSTDSGVLFWSYHTANNHRLVLLLRLRGSPCISVACVLWPVYLLSLPPPHPWQHCYSLSLSISLPPPPVNSTHNWDDPVFSLSMSGLFHLARGPPGSPVLWQRAPLFRTLYNVVLYIYNFFFCVSILICWWTLGSFPYVSQHCSEMGVQMSWQSSDLIGFGDMPRSQRDSWVLWE